MFNNYYEISVSGKDIRRFIKMLYKLDISFIRLTMLDNKFYAKVDLENYNKIMNIKTSYKIKVERVYGKLYLKEQLKNNYLFLLSFFIGILLIYFLSHIIFSIEIVHSDSKIREIMNEELEKYNIKKYSFIKSYDYIQEIKKNILNNNKNDLEWIEIERVGTKYIVKVDKRVIKDIEEETGFRNVVAKRDGIIKKIVAKDGEIVKKVNDYVAKKDIIISGAIHKGEDIKDNVLASGDVYAEVWYKVKVELPLNYYEKKYTGNDKRLLNIKFLNFNLNLFGNNYKNSETIINTLYSDCFNLFQVNISNLKEVLVIDDVNTLLDENKAVNMAKEKIESRLSKDEYIISQKKLKTTIKNSKINIEVFFKVYENISSYDYYSIKEGT